MSQVDFSVADKFQTRVEALNAKRTRIAARGMKLQDRINKLLEERAVIAQELSDISTVVESYNVAINKMAELEGMQFMTASEQERATKTAARRAEIKAKAEAKRAARAEKAAAKKAARDAAKQAKQQERDAAKQAKEQTASPAKNGKPVNVAPASSVKTIAKV
jgi:peptidoglycan hydrolase CwlO-like protein